MLSFNQVDSTKRKLISYEWLPVHLLLGGGKSRFFMRWLWADSFIWLSCRRVRSETRAQSNRTGEGENGLCCPWSNMLMKKKWSTVSQGKKNYTSRRLREMEKIFLSLSLSLFSSGGEIRVKIDVVGGTDTTRKWRTLLWSSFCGVDNYMSKRVLRVS